MSASIMTCPHCRYEAQEFMFENIDSDKLKCRRCRSSFPDPSAFVAIFSYADCDSTRAVTRFPFALNGKETRISVRDGYMGLLVDGSGSQQWLLTNETSFTGTPGGFQLFYVYQSPWILWGTKGLKEFGAYGRAQLSLTQRFVKTYCSKNHVLSLEAYLRSIVDEYITAFVQQKIDMHSTGQLEHTDGYLAMLGKVIDGVTLSKIEPHGYRTASGRPSIFPTFNAGAMSIEEEEAVPTPKPPLEIVKIPAKSYTIKNGVEEVFVLSKQKAERHKAGEIIEPDALRGVQKLLRYHQKQFELSYGWGVYNQDSSLSGSYFSAHGTVAFCIDGTEPLSLIIAKTGGWMDFEEQFFTNIFKKELSNAFKEVLGAYIRKGNFQPDRISEYLSSMSVDVTNQINGEGTVAREPALRRYGLRISQLDILDVDFYTKWR